MTTVGDDAAGDGANGDGAAGDGAAGDDADDAAVAGFGLVFDAAAACNADEPFAIAGEAVGTGRGTGAGRGAGGGVDAAGAFGNSTPTAAWYFARNPSSAATSPSGSL